MWFSVIYTVDIPQGVNMRPYVPPRCKKLWQETEGDENYGYGYLEGSWVGGRHRKWCALLAEPDFVDFVTHVGLVAESTNTMGSVGAPGYGFGWVPAISFRDDGEYNALLSAYVTPSGTAAEIVAFLLANGCTDSDIPGVLSQDPDQGVLPGMEKRIELEREAVWDMLKEAVIAKDWYDC